MDQMEAIRRRHNKTPMAMDFDVIIKRAYCNFEQIGLAHEQKMEAVIASLRGEAPRKAA